jgi:hypothetical protein
MKTRKRRRRIQVRVITRGKKKHFEVLMPPDLYRQLRKFGELMKVRRRAW